MAAITEPSKVNVTCPLCDEKVECTVHLDISTEERGHVLTVNPVFTPDVVEQFAPHLRQAHPLEYARMASHPRTDGIS